MAFTVSGQIVTQTASTTDTDLSTLVTLINGIPTVARSTAYTVGQVVRSPLLVVTWMYRCSVAGTTAASAPTYGTTEGGTTVDGGAQFVAHEGMQAAVTGTGLDTYRYVSLGSWQLIVNGTMTVNANAVEMLAFGANTNERPIVVNVGGTFTLGKRTTLNSTTRNEMPAGGIYSARRNAVHAFQGIHNNGGTINIFGRVAGNALPFYNQSGTVTFRDATWSCRQMCTQANVASMLFMAGGTIDVDGLTLEGEVSFVRVLSGNVTQFRNVRTVQSKGIAQNETSTTPFVVNDYSPSGNLLDSAFWQGAAQIRGVRHLNCAVGTNLYIAGTDAPTPTWGWVEMWRQMRPRLVNPDNSPVQGAILFIQDTNNGNRGAVSAVTGSGVTAGQTVTARDVNYLATDGIALGTTRNYINTGDSNGQTPLFEVLLGGVAIAQSGASTQPGYDTGSSRVDRRGKTDIQGSLANTDPFDLHWWSYTNQYTLVPNYSMLGTGVATPQSTALPDTSVTLTQAQAAALTQIDNLDQLNDADKNWKCQSQLARLLYPTTGTRAITPSGTELSSGIRAIVVDALAASAYSINTTTNVITIKSTNLVAGAKFKTLSSLATITAINGATISVPFTDANNAGSISVTGLAPTDTAQMRRASDNSLIATRTGPGAFAVAPANVGVSVYFVRLVGTNMVMSTITTPVTLTAGVNPEVPLFTGAQVQVANVENVATKADLAVVNNGVKKASLLIPHTTDLI